MSIVGGMAPFVVADGGRAEAGFEGDTDDCVVRAIVNFRMRHYPQSRRAEGYREVLGETIAAIKISGHTKPIPRGVVPGVRGDVFPELVRLQGLREVRLPERVRINVGQFARLLPDCIVYVRGHVTAVVGGRVHDTWDPRRRIAQIIWVDMGDQELARQVVKTIKRRG